MRIVLLLFFVVLSFTVSAQCNYEKDTLKVWMVVLTKVTNYKQVRIIEARQVLEFDRLCKGIVLQYLDLFKQPLYMDDFYILHISNTKIRL